MVVTNQCEDWHWGNCLRRRHDSQIPSPAGAKKGYGGGNLPPPFGVGGSEERKTEDKKKGRRKERKKEGRKRGFEERRGVLHVRLGGSAAFS